MIINGKTYSIICLDFETFYGPKYSLTSMSTTDYVYDKRFKIHGVGIDDRWYTDMAVLKTINWKKTALLCHNTAFDGFILHEKFNIHPGFYLDTLSMARATLGHHLRMGLDEVSKLLGGTGKLEGELIKTKGITTLDPEVLAALGVYCVNDVAQTRFVFDKLYPNVPDDELQLIDMTLRMFCEPVLRVNRARTGRELETRVDAKAQKLARTGREPRELRSRPKFARLLEEAGVSVPMKISKTTGLPTWALASSDEGFKQLLRHPDARVRELCEAKAAASSSIGETRAQRFLDVSRKGRPLPVALHYSGAHTHRWSGGNRMNMQNLERGGELRRCIRAPAGWSLVVVDSSQIEARFTAWLADEFKLLKGFKEGRDLYCEFASEIYHRKIVKADKAERFVGKTCILGLGYGMGPDRLHDTLMLGKNGPEVDIPRLECQKIIELYRSKYPGIPMLWKLMDRIIANMAAGVSGTFKCFGYGKEFIRLPGGLFLRYAGLRFDETGEYTYLSRTGRTKIWGGTLTENVVQALARRAIAENMLTIAKKYRIVLMTHDEIVYLAERAEAAAAYQFGLKTLSQTPVWAPGLPLSAEGGFAREYSK